MSCRPCHAAGVRDGDVPDNACERGFTLVELLVVVVILTLIAAIVVPRISASTDDAKLAALDADLARLRSAIDRYQVEHGAYPGSRDAAGGSCAGRSGTGTTSSPAERAITFVEQLTLYTNPGGKACSLPDTAHRFGPYLKTAEPGAAGLPANPVTGSNVVRVVVSGDLALASSASGGGWLYDPVSGRLLADDKAYDDR